MKDTPKLVIVVPCFNEQEVLPETMLRLNVLQEKLVAAGKVRADSRTCYVDDGSRDRTWEFIEAGAANDGRISGIKLSRNRGHQNALIAGLMNVDDADIVVSIDADLQDDVAAIERMVDAYLSGHDIVYGVRNLRTSDSVLKRATAEWYYRLLALMGVDVVFNHADFRLMSRRALDALKDYHETNLFLRGIVPTLGYPSTVVMYERHERFAGESKYPLRKMLALAADGITSSSPVPLRIIAGLGLVVFLASVLVSCWVLWVRLFTNNAVPGWASSVLPMYFLGGAQLLSIGVLGEYTAKLYMEIKGRPRYLIERRCGPAEIRFKSDVGRGLVDNEPN